MIGYNGFDGGCPLCCGLFAGVCFLLQGVIFSAIVPFLLVRLRLSAVFFFLWFDFWFDCGCLLSFSPYGSLAVVRIFFGCV